MKATVQRAYKTASGFSLSGSVVAGWAVVVGGEILTDNMPNVFSLKSAAQKQADFYNRQ